MPPRRCLCGCGRLIAVGSRCPESRTAQRAKYHEDGWRTRSRLAIAEHIATHGARCPGWARPAHETTDLTLDHEVGVLCRSCNTRKRLLGDR